ncbi:MAG: hypothetical protein ACRDQ5_22460 [Sciscionella sp.]
MSCERAQLFLLLRELSEHVDTLAYLILHQEATPADLTIVARECSAMAGALDRFAASRWSSSPTPEVRG